MIAALSDFQRLRIAAAFDAIKQSMLSIDPPRPIARKISTERLWLPDSGERVALAFSNERIDASRNLGVRRLPVKIILPSIFVEHHSHGSMSSCSTPSPASNLLIAVSNRSAFFGLDSR